jgi:hypothetical protein
VSWGCRWAMMLPASIQVCPIEIPGRGRRSSEPAIDDVHQLADALAASLPLQVHNLPRKGGVSHGMAAFMTHRAVAASEFYNIGCWELHVIILPFEILFTSNPFPKSLVSEGDTRTIWGKRGKPRSYDALDLFTN